MSSSILATAASNFPDRSPPSNAPRVRCRDDAVFVWGGGFAHDDNGSRGRGVGAATASSSSAVSSSILATAASSLPLRRPPSSAPRVRRRERLVLVLPPCRWLGAGGIRLQRAGLLRTLVAGGLGGMAKFTVGMPMDCDKTQVRSHGIAGFYRGYVYAILRAFPANGAAMLGVEIVNSLLRRWLLRPA